MLRYSNVIAICRVTSISYRYRNHIEIVERKRLSYKYVYVLFVQSLWIFEWHGRYERYDRITNWLWEVVPLDITIILQEMPRISRDSLNGSFPLGLFYRCTETAFLCQFWTETTHEWVPLFWRTESSRIKIQECKQRTSKTLLRYNENILPRWKCFIENTLLSFPATYVKMCTSYTYVTDVILFRKK